MSWYAARRAGSAPRRGPSLGPLNRGVLILFLIFSLVIGVREAHARTDLHDAVRCLAVCSQFYADWVSGMSCAICAFEFGRLLDKFWEGGWAGGWDCAKADIGC
jgi:hypothetical protein